MDVGDVAYYGPMLQVCSEIRRRLANKNSSAVIQNRDDVLAVAAIHSLLVGAVGTSGTLIGGSSGGLTTTANCCTQQQQCL
eukprot:scaffold131195_cov17-Prasinocladus_malaysianus.AAC.1